MTKTRDTKGRFTKKVEKPVKLSDDTYSFTTQEDDYYLPRVQAEAKPDSNFLLVRQTNVRTGEKRLILLVRSRILNIGEDFPNLILCGRPLSDWLDAALNSTDEWLIALVKGSDAGVKREDNIIVEEIKRIKNAIAGRNIKATVTSL